MTKLNLATLSPILADEATARAFLESRRWPNGPVCPHCEGEGYPLKPRAGAKTHARKGVHKCRRCRKQFTVTVGTVMEDSRIEIRKWLAAIHLMCSSKKGISAKQLERELGVRYQSAWYMCHRIREAMREELSQLGGEGQTVESDEVFIGGRKRPEVKGSGAVGKAPVQVVVERRGRAVAKHVERITATELRRNVKVLVHGDSIIATDQFPGYRGIGAAFKGGHQTVDHSRHFIDPVTRAHVNNAESFNSLLKRGFIGVYHQMSKKHLHGYLSEFQFRWNTRKVDDGQRMMDAIAGVKGKRLMYKNVVGP